MTIIVNTEEGCTEMGKKPEPELSIWQETILYIDYLSLPDEMAKEVNNWLGFGNDRQLPMSRRSEFDASSLNQATLEDYYKDQIETNGFEGTLEDFIDKYGLKFEKYLIDQNLDLEGVDEIVINISW